MTLEQAREKLKKYDQEHVLKYYGELPNEEKEGLLKQIEESDFEILKACEHKADLQKKGVITPLSAMMIDEVEAEKEKNTLIGLREIKRGRVAAVLLAGGMGTRLGSDDPKGMYNIGITREIYIFECLIKNLMEVVRPLGVWIHFFVMTSDKNNEATIAFFKKHDFFGYNPQYVHFFKQEMAVAADYNGKIFLEEKGCMSTSPNGNGGWFVSLMKSGLMDIIDKEDIRWLNIFAVDNVLQKIADPAFIGATILKKCDAGAKVIRKNARDERVGVMCLEDGKPSIVEYYELSDEMMDAVDENGVRLYNFGVILNYLFSVKALKDLAAKNLPLHIVEKKIPYIDENGNPVKPAEPNGYKFENLVLDMIHQMGSCLPYEVVREKEFAPIKNKTGVDSVESARELLKLNGVKL